VQTYELALGETMLQSSGIGDLYRLEQPNGRLYELGRDGRFRQRTLVFD